MSDSTLSDNTAWGVGGGILNSGSGSTVTITNSTLNKNAAAGSGGGIRTQNGGTVNVTNSTLSGNSGDNNGGGGILNFNSTVNVTNSTLTANSTASASGGGIATCIGCTGPVNVRSSIIAGNIGGTEPDVFGVSFTSTGFNLIGNNEGATASFPAGNPNANNDIVGSAAFPVDPKVDPAGLQNNGGPMRTIALLADSPAIDTGTSAGIGGVLTTDQRGSGFPRTADYSNVANAAGGDGTDIGAFEGTALKITSIIRLTNGHVLLQGLGIPNHAHTVEASPDLSPNSFAPFTTMPMADGTGVLLYDDATAAGLMKQFYRLRFP